MDKLLDFLKQNNWSTFDHFQYSHDIRHNDEIIVTLDENKGLAQIEYLYNKKRTREPHDLGFADPDLILEILREYPHYI